MNVRQNGHALEHVSIILAIINICHQKSGASIPWENEAEIFIFKGGNLPFWGKTIFLSF